MAPPPPPPPKIAAPNSAPLTDDLLPILPYLPEDLVIIEILTRLPVKPLFKFRCVCKSWDSLFYEPGFLKRHVKLAQQKLLVNSRPIFLKSFQVSTLLGGKSCTNTQEFRFPISSHKPDVRIVGSCNGLVCLSICSRGNESICFWNPSTKEAIRLPHIFSALDCNVYGFGFDESINDFKLVRAFADPSDEADWKAFNVEIYRVFDGSMKKIANFPSGFPYSRREGILLNGALHTLGLNIESSVENGVETKTSTWSIVALDLVTETFRHVPQPEFDDGGFKAEEMSMGLYCVGDSLCLVRGFHEAFGDVWVMKQYGVEESWVKLVRIPLWAVTANPYRLRVKPVYFSEKYGRLWIIVRDKLYSYDPKRNFFRVVNLHGINLRSKFFIQFSNHVDSLYSPSVMKGLRSGRQPHYMNQEG
ncbi:hypothetical protein COLO4_08445 [Corchorus olitorius]|uniref:F-box domain-containing protein n=1 Tax=Corchorus olitorius TaxID=93759 RepID=A0A1R3KFR6_9ROSI|nr:hypothetical protein COLO4_08445 [Corchorus olitorius]